MESVDRPREELEIERDWLRERVRDVGSYDALKAEVGGPAANAMVEYALGGELPAPDQYPRDERDLQSCLNTLERAPLHLRPRLEEVLARYRRETPLDVSPGVGTALPVAEFVSLLEQGQYVAEADMLPTGDYDEDDPLAAEWQWLRERARLAGVIFARDETVPRQWGVSANALIDYALGGKRPPKGEYPHDAGDLFACEQVAKTAPAHLRAKMEPVLAEYRRLFAPPATPAVELGPTAPAAGEL